MAAQEYEYRAIYRTKPSIISKPDVIARGYEDTPTSPHQTKEAARIAATRRAEEDMGYVVGYERRPVGAWEPAEDTP